MKTLKDKTFKISELLVYNTKKDKVLHFEDVKESVLELRKHLRMIESCKERNKYLDLHKKIFGNFEE